MLSPVQLELLSNLGFTQHTSYPGLEELGYCRIEDGVHCQVGPNFFEFSWVHGLTTLKHSRIHAFDPARFVQHFKKFMELAEPLIDMVDSKRG